MSVTVKIVSKGFAESNKQQWQERHPFNRKKLGQVHMGGPSCKWLRGRAGKICYTMLFW